MRVRRAFQNQYRKIVTILTCLESVFEMLSRMQNPRLLIGRNYLIVMGLLFLSLMACGTDDEQGPTADRTSSAACARVAFIWDPAPGCVSVSLIWDPVDDSTVIGYYIHYGKQSSDQPGSCAYDQLQFVSSPQGTVTGIDPGSIYYFAVSAYNGVEGACSNEVSAHT